MKTDFNQIQSIRSIRGLPFIVLFCDFVSALTTTTTKILGFWYLLLGNENSLHFSENTHLLFNC